ncbi:MAG: class I SAM-dependent methyltransferase [Burkholderiales bacterium]|jgi:2-polyprenyl-3-methyl-5-hydroxy-6-metoxy-1,4-benzoquinol methylase
MDFDYERDTKDHYKRGDVAEEYHAAFTSDRGWKAWRHRVVAESERDAVRRLLGRVPHERVLDLPCGTGKLAPVFADLGSSVTGCDISADMLALAEREYATRGVVSRLRVCDAERIVETLGERFHVAVCLRLLHRVPSSVKRSILAQLRGCADHAIVSAGIESTFHRGRRVVRRAMFGGDASALCFAAEEELLGLIEEHFEIVERRWVIPFASQEMVFLLRPRVGS